MTASEIKEAVAAINRVEAKMIKEMTASEYRAYKAIPAEDRKRMLYACYKISQRPLAAVA